MTMNEVVQLILLDELTDDVVDLSVLNHIVQTNGRVSSLMSGIVMDEEKNSTKSVAIQSYYEEVIPSYPDEGFRRHFRMTRKAAEVN
jgi:hypothetical protein